MSDPFLLGEEIIGIEGYDWEITIQGIPYGVTARSQEIRLPAVLKLRKLYLDSGDAPNPSQPVPNDGAELIDSDSESAKSDRDSELIQYDKPTIVNAAIVHISSTSLGVVRENRKPWEKSLPPDAFDKIFNAVMDRCVLDPKVYGG